MQRYRCAVCGYVYDEGAEGTPWGRVPDDWKCPICGASKSEFEAEAKKAEATPESATAADAPKRSRVSAVTIHRIFGYVFLAIYLVLLWQMVPRLWSYQIEFPARTAVHISLGMAVGVMLILKIAVVRYFKRFDTSLAPALGTCLLVGSVVLIGISAPAAFREALATGDLFGEENRERVRTLLTQAGVPEPESQELSTLDSLREGQTVLRGECVQCHDLRTVLAKPRTPENWLSTVRRMAERSAMVNPLTETDQARVTAYLVALSPGLQRSSKSLREQRELDAESREAAAALASDGIDAAEYDHAQAKTVFETKCSQCHTTKIVAVTRFESPEKLQQIISRMIEQGLNATEGEVAWILRYLTETYVKAEEP